MIQIKKSFTKNNVESNIKKEQYQPIFELGAIIEPKIGLLRKKVGNFPEVDFAKCIKCGICQKNCPEGAVKIIKKGRVKKVFIDHFFCKNCGICAEICPKKAIKTEKKRL